MESTRAKARRVREAVREEMQEIVSRSEAAHEAKRQRTEEEGAGGGGRVTRGGAARARKRMPDLPDEVLPTLLQSLELQGRPLAAVGKAWRAAVRELRHAVLLVAGEDYGERLRPVYPPGGVLITEVSLGADHTLAVTAAGLLFGRGSNGYGQLGFEASVERVDTLVPVPLPDDGRAARVACGGYFSFVTTTTDALLACGLNGDGQLGLGADLGTWQGISGLRWVALPDNAQAAQVTCGYDHTCILTRTGILLGCGTNDYGQLGLGDSGADAPSAQAVPLPAGAVASQVVCGYKFTCVVTTSGVLLACGWNDCGQLGLGQGSDTYVRRLTAVPVPAPVKQVACGSTHTCVLTVDGAVLTCGRNKSGQLGLNGVPTGPAAKVRELRPVALPGEAAQVACGREHTFVVSAGGALLGWGVNHNGQLGLGHCQNQSLPQPVPLPAGALRVTSVGGIGCVSECHTCLLAQLDG